MRATLAIIIALSLILAPFTTAQAMSASAATVHAHAAMSDCHKAQHRKDGAGDHDCCRDRTKSNCPDKGCNCVFKCGMQLYAIFATPDAPRFAPVDDFHALNAAKPPGLDSIPAAPPPRT